VKDVGIWIAIALVGLSVGLAMLLGGTERQPEPAPPFTLRSLEGIDVSLDDYRGQLIILDFWATWCKPCTTTFPELHALVEAYADDSVVMLVISLDRSEKRAREYLTENGYATDKVLWGSLTQARSVKELYGVGGIPRTFLIDRDGLIRFAGYPTRLTAEKIEAWL